MRNNDYKSDFAPYAKLKGQIQEKNNLYSLTNCYLKESIAKTIAQYIEQEDKLIKPNYQYVDNTDERLSLTPDYEFSELIKGKSYAIKCELMTKENYENVCTLHKKTLKTEEYPIGIKQENIFFYYGNDTKQETYIPKEMYTECLWYFALGKYDGIFLGILEDNKLHIYYITPDQTNIEWTCNKVKLWLKKIDSREYTPKPQNENDIDFLYPNHRPTKCLYTEELEELITQYKENTNIYTTRKKELSIKIKSIMKENLYAVDKNNKIICMYKTSYKESFNKEKFKEENLPLYIKYCTKVQERKLNFNIK